MGIDRRRHGSWYEQGYVPPPFAHEYMNLVSTISCLHCGGICNNASMDISRDMKSQRLPKGCQAKTPTR